MQINLVMKVLTLPTPCCPPSPSSSSWIRAVFQGAAGPAVCIAGAPGEMRGLTWPLTLNHKGGYTW